MDTPHPGATLPPFVRLLADDNTDWKGMPAGDLHGHAEALRRLPLAQHLRLMHHLTGRLAGDHAHPGWRLLADGLRRRPPGPHVPLDGHNRTRAWHLFPEELPPGERWRVPDFLHALPHHRPHVVYAPQGVAVDLLLARELGVAGLAGRLPGAGY